MSAFLLSPDNLRDRSIEDIVSVGFSTVLMPYPRSFSARRSEHRVVVLGGSWHGLQHIPVLDDLAINIEAENVNASDLLAKQIQVAHMNECQVVVDCDPFYL